MKGLELSRQYYEEFGRAMLENTAPGLADRAAVGLVGEGSQCFGFDDEISQDHDFAPGFCVWLSAEDYGQCGEELQRAYCALPESFLGFSRKNILAAERLGVMTVGGFYARFTGNPGGVPATVMNWLFTSEQQLAAATNGAVFRDDGGDFTAIRRQLLAFYPEDVLRKKLAARAAVMSQAGQYNLLRVIKRGDQVAALLSLARFTEAALSAIYLLNRRYMPFYKWAFHGLSQLPLVAPEAAPIIGQSGKIPEMLQTGRFHEAGQKAFELTETICQAVADEMNRQGFSASRDAFLQNNLSDIMDGIKDPQLRGLPPMVDCGS